MDQSTQAARRRLLLALLEKYGCSLAQFGAILARSVGRAYPYSKTYIIRLRDGKDPIPDKLAVGLVAIAQQQASTSRLVQPCHSARVISPYPLHDKTIVLGAERFCANPDCRVLFVPNHPARRYCSLACRRHAARLRRQALAGC